MTIIIYNTGTIIKLNLLDKLQRRCAVICLKLYKLTGTIKLYRELGWDTLEHIGTHKLYLMYKIIEKNIYVFLPRPSHHTYATRNINNLKRIRCQTSRYRSGFLPSTNLAWNNLNTNVWENPTMNLFNAQFVFFKPHKVRNTNIFALDLSVGITLEFD